MKPSCRMWSIQCYKCWKRVQFTVYIYIYIYVYVTNAHTHKHTHTLDPNIQNITNRLCVSSGAMRCQECPGCGVRTLRSMGCNHMTCAQCAMHWCWVCGRPWQPWHYGCTANSQGSADCSLMWQKSAKRRAAQQCWAGKSHVLCQLGSHEESLY